MTAVRLIPVILSGLMLSAHFMRFHGFVPVIIVLLLLFMLFLRQRWVLRLWQFILFASALVWVDTSFKLVHLRLSQGLPWSRMAVILGVVTLFTIFSGVWLENKRIKSAYPGKKNTEA